MVSSQYLYHGCLAGNWAPYDSAALIYATCTHPLALRSFGGIESNGKDFVATDPTLSYVWWGRQGYSL